VGIIHLNSIMFMPVKLRLQRHGRKRRPFYYIVAADARAKRDGRFIERIGYYDPNHHPAHVDIDAERALSWMKNGAQPTNTVRSILSQTGVLYKKHLQRGVAKGALTQAEADTAYANWVQRKMRSQNARMILFDLNEWSIKLPSAEAPVTEDAPATEETPATEEAPVTAEAPVAEEAPASEETSTEETAE
jgi:small subunit ribosomal protein S16